MYKRGMFLALLALLSVVPAVGTDDRVGQDCHDSADHGS